MITEYNKISNKRLYKSVLFYSKIEFYQDFLILTLKCYLMLEEKMIHLYFIIEQE